MDPLTELVEIERIKKLKARYQRFLDLKDYDGLTACFAPDASSSYGDGEYSFSPREKIIEFLRGSMSSPEFVTLHQVHTPEIEILSETTASGTWYLQDIVIDAKNGRSLLGAGFYHDEYIKLDGEWKIKHTGYERTFEQWQDRSDPSLRLSHRFETT